MMMQSPILTIPDGDRAIAEVVDHWEERVIQRFITPRSTIAFIKEGLIGSLTDTKVVGLLTQSESPCKSLFNISSGIADAIGQSLQFDKKALKYRRLLSTRLQSQSGNSLAEAAELVRYAKRLDLLDAAEVCDFVSHGLQTKDVRYQDDLAATQIFLASAGAFFMPAYCPYQFSLAKVDDGIRLDITATELSLFDLSPLLVWVDTCQEAALLKEMVLMTIWMATSALDIRDDIDLLWVLRDEALDEAREIKLRIANGEQEEDIDLDALHYVAQYFHSLDSCITWLEDLERKTPRLDYQRYRTMSSGEIAVVLSEMIDGQRTRDQTWGGAFVDVIQKYLDYIRASSFSLSGRLISDMEMGDLSLGSAACCIVTADSLIEQVVYDEIDGLCSQGIPSNEYVFAEDHWLECAIHTLTQLGTHFGFLRALETAIDEHPEIPTP